MHSWGDDNVDWKGISDAAHWIGATLRRWGRINVSDTKEKFGTVRVYCSFGWWSVHNITHPGYHYVQWKKVGHIPVPQFVNYLIVPLQQTFYRLVYRRALQKWPHLAGEILVGADYHDLLVSLHPYLKYEKTPGGWHNIRWDDPNHPQEPEEELP